MKLTTKIFCLGAVLLWTVNGSAQPANANGGSSSAWDQQLQARDLTGKRGKEQVDSFTGSFGYSVPINCPPARNGSEPALALRYSSGSDNGWCGMGWALDIGYIERNTKEGFPVQFTSAAIPAPATAYDDSRGFLMNLFGKDYKLFAVSAGGSTVEYRAEVDTEFLRCFLNTNNNTWTVYDKSGNAYLFGQSASSRVANPKTGWSGYSGTFHWGMDEIDTATGDQTTVGYTNYTDPEGLPERTIYPTQITYNGHISLNGYATNATGNSTVTFGTEIRPDRRVSFRWGFRTEQNRRLTNIVCQVGSQKAWRYALAYTKSTATERSLLSTVTVYGSDDTTALPVQTFTYQQNPKGVSFGQTFAWTNLNLSDPSSSGTDPYLTQVNSYGTTIADLLDIDGDGLPDRVAWDTSVIPNTFRVQHNSNGSFGSRFAFGPTSTGGGSTASDSNPLPDGSFYSALNSGYSRIRDINGDGLPDRVDDWWKHFVYYTTYPYTNFEVSLNTGSGFTSPAQWPVATNELGLDSSTYMSLIESGTAQPYVGLMDVNGDGLPDRIMALYNQPENYFKVQFNTGTNFSPLKFFGPYRSQNYTNTASGIPWSGINTPEATMMDMNGDGLPDRLMIPMNPASPPSPMVYGNPNFNYFAIEYNNGYSFESTNSSSLVPGAYDRWPGVVLQSGGTPYNYDAIQNLPVVGMYDLNGDGLPDRVMLDETAFSQGKAQWLVYLNQGTGFDPNPIAVPIDAQGQTGDRGWCGLSWADSGNSYSVATTLIDINGDGLLDRVMKVYDNGFNNANSTSNFFLVQLNDGPFPDLLTNINNGIGGNTAVTYSSSTAFDNRVDPTSANSVSRMPFPHQVVTTVTESDGVNSPQTTTYGYGGGFYDGVRREFHGFAVVTNTDPTFRSTVTYFHTGGGRNYAGLGEYQDTNSTTGAGNFAKSGMAYRVETYGNDNLLYHVQVNEVNQTGLGNGRYFPFTALSFDCDYPGGGSAKVTASQFAYDLTTGSLTNKIEYGQVTGFNPASVGSFTFTDADGTDTREYNTIYASISGNSYIVDHPATVNLTDTNNNSIRETDYSYNSGSGTIAAKLTRISAGYYATNSYGNYTAYGLVGLATDPEGIQTTITYDSAYNTFPVTTRVHNTPSDFITTTTYDARSGDLATSIDPAGLTISNSFDALYRPTETDKIPIGGGTAVWVKRYAYPSVFKQIVSGLATNYVDVVDNDGVGGYTNRTYSDGFGRTLQTRVQGENNNVRVVTTAYDGRGNPFVTTWPVFGATLGFTRPTNGITASWTGYDAAGRAATNRAVNVTFNSTTGAFSSKTDLTGDTGSPLGATIWSYVNGSDPWWIFYTDPDGQTRRYGLDAFGRTNQILEIDGTSTYTNLLKYDLADDLTNLVNANGENIYWAYNDAGAMVAMSDPYLGRWTYVRDYAGRVRVQTDGRIDVISNSYVNASGQQDALGRLQVQTVFSTVYSNQTLVPAYTNTFVYDSSDDGNYTVYPGQLYKVVDKQGFEKIGYDTLARTIKTTRYLNINTNSYTTTNGYDGGDNVVAIGYPSSGPTVNYSYFHGRSINQVSLAGASYNYYSANASAYDEFEHVTGFTYGSGLATTRSFYTVSKRLQTTSSGSAGAIFNRTYKYSAGNDITNLNGSGITNVNVSYYNLHRIKTFTGLTGSYGFDPTGNITNNIEGGGSSYSYANPRKQAVRTAFGYTNLYDLCGNMMVRHGGLTNAQALTYDPENRLSAIAQAGVFACEFGYGYDGARLWKHINQNPTNIQVWIGNIYEEKGGKKLFHVFAGGEQVCTFETNSVLYGGSDTNRVGYYYHEDNLNSSSALSSSGGSQIEVNAYYPFGRTLTATPQASFQMSRRFTGQVFDAESGLYYCNARYYDPELGRFIQPDDIIPDFSNPQSYNRYSYCHNDPLTYSDPSGHADHIWDIYNEHDPDPFFADLNRRSNQAADAKMATIIARENDVKRQLFNNAVKMGVDSMNPLNASVGPLGAVTGIGGEMKAVAAADEVANAAKSEAAAVKGPVKPGDMGTYGELKAQKQAHGETEPLDMDHQPSFKAQVKAAEAAKGEPLTKDELAALKANTPAVASPRLIHQQTSPTYGGRNTDAQSTADAANPQAAQARDKAAFDQALSERSKKQQ